MQDIAKLDLCKFCASVLHKICTKRAARTNKHSNTHFYIIQRAPNVVIHLFVLCVIESFGLTSRENKFTVDRPEIPDIQTLNVTQLLS